MGHARGLLLPARQFCDPELFPGLRVAFFLLKFAFCGVGACAPPNK